MCNKLTFFLVFSFFQVSFYPPPPVFRRKGHRRGSFFTFSIAFSVALIIISPFSGNARECCLGVSSSPGKKTVALPLKTWGNCQWVSQKNCLKNHEEFVESLPLKRELRICKGREGKGKRVAEKCLLRDHENQPEIPVNFAGVRSRQKISMRIWSEDEEKEGGKNGKSKWVEGELFARFFRWIAACTTLHFPHQEGKN